MSEEEPKKSSYLPQHKRYYQANRERILAKAKARYSENQEYREATIQRSKERYRRGRKTP